MSGLDERAIQRGSALSEFVVLMLAAIPLMFGIPMIGKLVDLKHASVQASRYAAWETTVSTSQTPPDDLRARFFSDPSAPAIGDRTTAASNPLWGATAAPANTSSGPAADTRVAIDENSVAGEYLSAYDGEDDVAEGPALAMGTAIHAAGNLVDGLTNGDWDGIEPDGLVRATVAVDVEQNGWLTRSSMRQSSAIMSDGWSAADDDEAAARARSFVPAGALGQAGIGQVLDIAGKIPLFKELDGFVNDEGQSAFGYVDMQPLPESEADERLPRYGIGGR